jgi:hypothetical protein
MTAPVGFGLTPRGVGPYGYGTPATAPVPGGGVLRDEKTGATLTGRRIDPRTRQYVFDEYGRILGMPTVPQLMHLALHTEKGSSVLADLGHELRDIETIGADYEHRVETTLAEALSDLVQRGLIRIDKVTTTRFGATGLYTVLSWTDLTTSQEHDTEI